MQLLWKIKVHSTSIKTLAIRLSEVQKKTGVKLVHNGIAGRNLGQSLLFCSQIPSYNAITDEFGTSLSMNIGKANSHTMNLQKFFSSDLNLLYRYTELHQQQRYFAKYFQPNHTAKNYLHKRTSRCESTGDRNVIS